MLMPYAEPFVVRSIKAVVDRLDEPLRSAAVAYARQEGQHHAQHRRFNDLVVARHPVLRLNERWMGRAYRVIERRSSPDFGVAFAAGFESVAYVAARWVASRHTTLLGGADPAARDLFLWHLAEEVEHKSVAFEVHEAIGGRRFRYAVAMMLSAFLLAWFSFANTLAMLAVTGRILNPLAHLRLLFWSISFVFDLLPAMAVSAMPGHHPRDLVDPLFFDLWLAEHRGPQ